MAREWKTAAEVAAIAQDLASAVTNLNAIHERMDQVGMEKVFIHWGSAANRFVPRILEWAAKARGDAEGLAVAFKKGVESTIEKDHRANSARKKSKKS